MASGPYNYSYIFKYIIIGDMGVGKSCLLHQFTEKKCNYFVSCYIIYIFAHIALLLLLLLLK